MLQELDLRCILNSHPLPEEQQPLPGGRDVTRYFFGLDPAPGVPDPPVWRDAWPLTRRARIARRSWQLGKGLFENVLAYHWVGAAGFFGLWDVYYN